MEVPIPLGYFAGDVGDEFAVFFKEFCASDLEMITVSQYYADVMKFNSDLDLLRSNVVQWYLCKDVPEFVAQNQFANSCAAYAPVERTLEDFFDTLVPLDLAEFAYDRVQGLPSVFFDAHLHTRENPEWNTSLVLATAKYTLHNIWTNIKSLGTEWLTYPSYRELWEEQCQEAFKAVREDLPKLQMGYADALLLGYFRELRLNTQPVPAIYDATKQTLD